MVRSDFSGWFTIDLVSIFPFDLIGIAMESGNASDLKILRVVRCLRLIKLIRLIKASTTLQKYERKYGINHSTIMITKFLIGTVVISHWLSCMWMLVVKLEAAEANWATEVRITTGPPSCLPVYLSPSTSPF